MTTEKQKAMTVAERNKKWREGKSPLTIYLPPHIRDAFHEATNGLGAASSAAYLRDFVNTTIDRWQNTKTTTPREAGAEQAASEKKPDAS